jgi:hypothetical protein
MSNSQNQNRKASPSSLKAGRRRMSGKKLAAKKTVRRRTYNEAARAPATPLMMKPFQAWQQLCARTGASIGLGTFYAWIRQLRICSVRVGWKIFIPIPELDRLVERCLRGERD